MDKADVDGVIADVFRLSGQKLTEDDPIVAVLLMQQHRIQQAFKEQQVESGQSMAEFMIELEQRENAIIQAAKLGIAIEGSTLYCTHQPCVMCAKMIVNAGIARVVYEEGYPDEFSMEIMGEAKVLVERYEAPGT